VNKEKPRLQANIAVKTGSRNDPAETTGLAHYLEHLMFKGTQKFGTIDHAKEKPYLDEITRRYESYRKLTDPAQRKQAYHEIDSISQLAAKYNIPNEYDKLMASIGSQGTNAYTSNDVTCYVENIPNNEIENWAKVQSDRFQNMDGETQRRLSLHLGKEQGEHRRVPRSAIQESKRAPRTEVPIQRLPVPGLRINIHPKTYQQ
jgi:predicted Zn-dependent peptidase